jgi:hypothetical protein
MDLLSVLGQSAMDFTFPALGGADLDTDGCARCICTTNVTVQDKCKDLMSSCTNSSGGKCDYYNTCSGIACASGAGGGTCGGAICGSGL